MKKKTRILSLILAVVLTVGILPAGVSAAYFPQAGAIDGAGGVANAVEAFLRGDLHHPDAGEVTGKVGDVLANIDVEHMEQVVAQQLINYDYNTAVKLLGKGVINITQKEIQNIVDIANGKMPADVSKASETRYFWVFMNDKTFYTGDSDNLVLQPVEGADVHMIGMTLTGRYVALSAKTDKLGMATFDDVPYGQYFCGASYIDPNTGYSYETETMSEHVWVPATGKLQNLTMTRVDALSNSWLDDIKRQLVALGGDPGKILLPGGSVGNTTGTDGTTIVDEDTPLAGAVTLNSSDHTAYINGVGQGKFAPGGKLTRAQAAQMLYNLLSSQSQSAYFKTTNSFCDVKPGSWYNIAVSTLANAGVINGYADGSFKPDKCITRAELVKLITAMYGEDATAVCSFTDVSAGSWYYSAAATAGKNGWILGDGGSAFRPNDSMSRAEAVTFLNRVLSRSCDLSYVSANTVRSFIDVEPDAWYYAPVMEAANGHYYTVSASGAEAWTSLR